MSKIKNRLSGIGLIAPDKDKYLTPAEEAAVLTFLSDQFGFITNLQAVKPTKAIAVGNYPYEVGMAHYALMQEIYKSILLLAQARKKKQCFYFQAALNLLYLKFIKAKNESGQSLSAIIDKINRSSDNKVASPIFIWNALLFYLLQPKGEIYEN